MNRFKFDDCRDCAFLGFGIGIKECVTCTHGENFEEIVPDVVDFMELYDDED